MHPKTETPPPLKRLESDQFPLKWTTSSATNTNNTTEQSEWNAQNKQKTDDDDENQLSSIKKTPDTEKKHVHAVYDAIAKQWNHTRGKRGVLWPGATEFVSRLDPGSIVADVGCGDGKYFPAIWEAQSFVIGTDISLPLLETTINGCNRDGSNDGPKNRCVAEDREALNKRPPIAVADCMNLPLRTNGCDAAICIAVMHHLSTEPRRLQCLRELARIVKVGGCINVQAWAKEQEATSRRKFNGTDVFVPFNAQPRYLDRVVAEQQKTQKKSKKKLTSSNEHLNHPHSDDETKKDNSDTKGVAQIYSEAYDGAEYDESKGLVVFQRYCHLYRKGELESLVAQLSDRLELITSGFETGNYFMILRVIG
eukprot:CAMPEP_0197841284 /NCGR_PEP_ID=MMETSP1437-20131217/46085_1 /TAXON_ID=49252 ORGANISM="Eucampia antarctica, Strain CCMP1452" /NCGR_SAMPLE_ID=MMETSP1437 /ASSEMBLY_ACC=CAM_ASM_001096 /LENGTH=365 /DNA_ID=CAMNT_0043451009 /DNA_START=38 /DNA_END=1135 /DNA_ORIENTATION=+